ncbi:hypothetical protein HX045_14625 [Myroides odoratimimus]|uniref:DUF4890 domain-containing protein n=2 Tax=Myroides odoratimimus TaxID=76832 RepID=A0ABP2NFG8_9FLAO|nr:MULTISPECIES: hypothetical protein [Myroides]AJA69080.1 hypothetical protein MYRA21_1944 [Myroides sp. A21]APA92368.1 hypothetical protein BK054_09105 [Myroides sp. ZB35]EHO12203.1 hypothetical protein HMPREF9712_00450 [Myroides odoratimimus CCUG 10230]EHO13273.1 hypothetical protein HMPREF9714_00830 [Myroides odoratimimus CCUG 12901]EHO14167.1 hypothetical protein HMPREF9715_00838 [Myroides odoratimimus CIP 101113]
MRRVLVLGALLVFTSIYAQSPKNSKQTDYEVSASELLDKGEYYKLTESQRTKIIERKRTIGREFEAIGRDRSLSGREKGLKKRELARSFRQDIYIILNDSQKVKWDKASHHKYQNKSYKNDIEHQLDMLEIEYERDIKNIEIIYKDNDSKRKIAKNNRKAEYKQQKAILKRQKDKL